MAETIYDVKNIYDLIDLIRQRPGMYIGNSKISTMNTFLQGYSFATDIHRIERKNEFPPFWYFHEWAMQQYNWFESTAGWKNIILKENNNDEEKALQVFFQFIDEFKTLHPINIEKARLTALNLSFHHSDECKIKYGNGKPIYESADEVLLVQFSHNFGLSYFVVSGGKVNDLEWRERFKNAADAKRTVERLFGQVEWHDVDEGLKDTLIAVP